MAERKKVLVVGDIMVDRYRMVDGDGRNAPEAPIPVWNLSHEYYSKGGAANTAQNLWTINHIEGGDIDVYLAGIIGREGREKVFSRTPRGGDMDVRFVMSGDTMYKTRYVDCATKKYLMRVDSFKKFDPMTVQVYEKFLENRIRGYKWDAVIFSDYDKGTITRRVVEAILPGVMGGVTVVDSKRLDLSIFQKMDVLKVNESEYSTQVSKGPYTNVEGLFTYVVVTKGAEGAQLRQALQKIVDRRKSSDPEVIESSAERYIVQAEDFPVIATKAVDVTGCGDTHTAAMAFSMLRDRDIRRAVKYANDVARDVVQQFGTALPNVRTPR